MSDQPAPTIYILAGPNGAGKTSLYQYAALAVPRLNGDSLYQQGLAIHEVEASLRQQLEEWTTQRISFIIETNAASERDYKLFSALKDTGYQLELRYVGLESVAICQKRVAQRVLEGGHDVPLALIQQRYTNGLSLLKQHYRIFDRIQMYDNTGTEVRQVADFLPGGPLFQLAQPRAWGLLVLQHITRMKHCTRRSRNSSFTRREREVAYATAAPCYLQPSLASACRYVVAEAQPALRLARVTLR